MGACANPPEDGTKDVRTEQGALPGVGMHVAPGFLAGYILPNAANLVGVCIMALSLVKLLPRHGWTDNVDEVLAIDSMLFLASVALSYASLRMRSRSARLEAWAERIFLLGLGLIMLASGALAFGIG